MLQITYSDRFQKHYKKLTKQERDQFKEKLKLFVSNPYHPSLRTKHIQGSDNLFEFSVNMDIRVIWHYDGDNLVVLVDIGHHNVLDKY